MLIPKHPSSLTTPTPSSLNLFLDEGVVEKVNQLEQLGFENRTLNAFLLQQFDGNMEECMKHLVDMNKVA
jgi:hypothetical protein